MKNLSFNSIKLQILIATIISFGLMNCTDRKILPDTNDVMAFHQSLLTIDTHVDTPIPIKRKKLDLGQRHNSREINSKLDFPRMKEGGLDAAFFAVWTAQGARTDSGHAAIK